MALGTVAVSPLELTAAYTAFAGLGTGVTPRLIVQVEDPDKEVVWSSEVETRRVLQPAIEAGAGLSCASLGRGTAVALPTASICNAEGGLFLRSPEGPGTGRPHGVVASSLCAKGTRPRPRLALQPASARRGHALSVNRP